MLAMRHLEAMLLLALAAACGGTVGTGSTSQSQSADAAPSSGGAGGAGAGGAGASPSSGGSNNTEPVTPLPDGGCPYPTVYDGVSQCIEKTTAVSDCKSSAAQEGLGLIVDDATCSAGCDCTYCTAEMLLCETLPDCMKILACGQKYNCSGVDCYTADRCQSVIESAENGVGLTSLSVAYAELVTACAAKGQFGSTDYYTRVGPVCQPGCL